MVRCGAALETSGVADERMPGRRTRKPAGGSLHLLRQQLSYQPRHSASDNRLFAPLPHHAEASPGAAPAADAPADAWPEGRAGRVAALTSPRDCPKVLYAEGKKVRARTLLAEGGVAEACPTAATGRRFLPALL